ncbi:MAG TPA: hypothetical protein VKY74_19680 [Chloroflexia bacterium]|nr:hypothetical protein [Chloroflexia bacterium]
MTTWGREVAIADWNPRNPKSKIQNPKSSSAERRAAMDDTRARVRLTSLASCAG